MILSVNWRKLEAVGLAGSRGGTDPAQGEDHLKRPDDEFNRISSKHELLEATHLTSSEMIFHDTWGP
jgi:hypothetical protein